MAEVLVKAVSATHADPEQDRRGCYKRGMPVVVQPDGHPWGAEERLPKFVVLKIPLVPVARVERYVAAWLDPLDPDGQRVYGRRRWQIRWDDLPLAARTTLRDTGQLVIKATDAYTGPFQYTWTQVKTFFRNLETGTDETEDV